MKALEKNQQWLLYDQQREAYVRGLLRRIFELEQKSEIASHQESKEFNSEGIDFIFSPQVTQIIICYRISFLKTNYSTIKQNQDFLLNILVS